MKESFSPDVERLKKEMEYRNYSDRTVYSYCVSMHTFEKSIAKPLFLAEVKDLKAYLHQILTVKNCSIAYVNQHISAFKILCPNAKNLGLKHTEP